MRQRVFSTIIIVMLAISIVSFLFNILPVLHYKFFSKSNNHTITEYPQIDAFASWLLITITVVVLSSLIFAVISFIFYCFTGKRKPFVFSLPCLYLGLLATFAIPKGVISTYEYFTPAWMSYINKLNSYGISLYGIFILLSIIAIMLFLPYLYKTKV